MSGYLAPSRGRGGHAAKWVLAAAALAGLTACSAEESAVFLGMPPAATEEASSIGNLWVGAWIACLVIGGLMWGLIGWAVVRYRRREGDAPAPRQTTYHLPLELLYTLVPFLIIGVLFFYTVKTQDAVYDESKAPETTIGVIGQKWSWTFNYMEKGNPDVGTDAHEVGTLEKIPDLYLPVGKRVRFNLNSADVIHSFWIPSFRNKLDVIPGHPNSFTVVANKEGTYDGKCAELCGQYHALMLFKVHVVSEAEYEAKVKELASNGNAGERSLHEAQQAALPTEAPQEHK